MYLKIENAGEVAPEAFTLLGASSKRGDGAKIGMFGSGNKYAMAYFLRKGINFRVFSGTKEIVISTKSKNFRDKDFDVITVNGAETSITTDSGPKWKLWQAIREIYSNAIDEGQASIGTETSYMGEPGKTRIYIETNVEIMEFYNRIGEYFAIGKRAIYESQYGKIYSKTTTEALVYRKGIKCYDFAETSSYDYDFPNLEINESRIVERTYDIYEAMAMLLYTCEDVSIIKKIIREFGQATVERSINGMFVSTDARYLSEQWREAIEKPYVAPNDLAFFMDASDIEETCFLPTKFSNDMIERFGDGLIPPSLRRGSGKFHYKPAAPTELELRMLEEVQRFFRECQFEINYPIDIVVFSNPDLHGKAYQGKILINQVAFTKGKEWVANIIIEELIHLKYKADDGTRKFQDSVIAEFLMYMKTINSYSL